MIILLAKHPMILWIIFELLEASRHVLLMYMKQSPNKRLSLSIRAIVLMIILRYEPIPFGYAFVLYGLVAWWIHDYVINLLVIRVGLDVSEARRGIWYLNNTGPIDRFQHAFGGAPAWFFMKSIVFLGAIAAYFINDWNG